jgi:hypothetical protein
MLLSVSCRTKLSFDKEYNSFYKDATDKGCLVLPTLVEFADLESPTAGLCFCGVGILLSEQLWAEYKPFQRMELMYHELGHCVLYLEHSDPGLMSSEIHSEVELIQNWTTWKDLLFQDCKATTHGER